MEYEWPVDLNNPHIVIATSVPGRHWMRWHMRIQKVNFVIRSRRKFMEIISKYKPAFIYQK